MLHKILFAGPVGAGKTTAIASVSDSEVVQTDARASDEVSRRKQQTTVAMDYGTLRVDTELNIQLVGTPGQDRFDFMWEILAKGAIGVVILIDNARPDPMDDLESYLATFRNLLDQEGGAGVVGVTRMDISRSPALSIYRERIHRCGYALPVFEVDARSRKDVKTALLALTSELNPKAHRRRTA